MKRHSYPLSVLLAVGLVSLYIGERIVAVGTARGVFSVLGIVAVIAAVVLRALRVKSTPPEATERRAIERGVLGLYLGVLAAVFLYLLQSDAVTVLGMTPLETSSPKLAVVLRVLWIAVLTCSLFPLLLVEQSYAAMVHAPKVERGRVREALFSGMGIAFVLVFAFAAYYVANERNTKWDFSYFRTARAGDATKNLARSLTEPITVSLFYPPANEVREELVNYLSDLTAQTDKLTVESLDQAVDVGRAKELGITANGAVVLSRGKQKEQLLINVELERARTQLRNLDKELNKRLTSLSRGKRTVYLVAGHGERAVDKSSPQDQRWTIRVLRDQLQALNYEVKTLGAAEGLASEVPQDAGAVFLLGPTSALMAEEVSALEAYFKRGGRLFVALDPESGPQVEPLLTALGLKFVPTMLANDQAFLRRTHQASDRINILTKSFTSHPSVTSLSRLGSRAPMLLVGAGYLEHPAPLPKDVRVDTTVNAEASTWNDVNGNFDADTPPEVRRGYELAVAVTLKRGASDAEAGRALVVADSDLLTDAVVENVGNFYFFLDGTKWLLGDESLAGEITSETDVPIEHTKKQDVAWFYAMTFLAPALVLGGGFLVTRRRGRRKGSAAREGAVK